MVDEDEHHQIAVAGIDGEWRRLLESHMKSGSMAHLMAFLERRRRAGAAVYPPQKYLYAALRETPYEAVRVVIIGQDPYHGLGQAHGLCFSVQPQVDVPPSLRNIYRELAQDVDFHAPQHGCLSHWADQGVLLLNAVLSVEQGAPGSHRGRGWEGFTDDIIERLNQHSDRLVFMPVMVGTPLTTLGNPCQALAAPATLGSPCYPSANLSSSASPWQPLPTLGYPCQPLDG